MDTPASVVIVTYQREQILLDTIHSVLNALRPQDELIVIDQTPAHTPECAGVLAVLASHPQVRYEKMQPPSMTAARNQGARLAGHEIIIYVDDDVFVEPGFIEGHLKPYADPKVWAVQGPVRNPAGRMVADSEGDTWHTLLGCNMSIRHSALYQAGGFDVNLFGSFIGEEGELADRLQAAGGRIAFSKDCMLLHRAEVEGGAGNRSRADAWHYSTYHNCFYILLKKPWRRLIRSVPWHFWSMHRFYAPSRRRRLSPWFFLSVYLRGHLHGMYTRLFGQRGPFLAPDGPVGSPMGCRQQA